MLSKNEERALFLTLKYLNMHNLVVTHISLPLNEEKCKAKKSGDERQNFWNPSLYPKV